MPSVVLRPYQKEAIDCCLTALHQHHRALLVMATGLGKTLIFSEVAKYYQQLGRVLILAHREELVWQAAETLQDQAPGVEMAQWHSGSQLFGSRVTIGTVQTVMRRLDKFKPNAFSLVVIDEAHHSPAASYQKIINWFSDAKVLGVTATPKRHDRIGLGKIFSHVAYIYDLACGIRDGWLVPIAQYLVRNMQVDFTTIRKRSGDFAPEVLERILLEEENLHAVAKVALDATSYGPVLVFTTGIQQSDRLAEVINRYKPNMAQSVSQHTPKMIRRGIITRFRNGEVPILCNCMIATEGFDAPKTASIVMARPTRSLMLYTQMLGRGTRPLAGIVTDQQSSAERRQAIQQSMKPKLRVYDLVRAQQITQVITAADALSGSTIARPDTVVQVWKEQTADRSAQDGIADVLAELDAYRIEHQTRVEMSRRHIKADKIAYEVKNYHPCVVLNSPVDISSSDEPMTSAQQSFLTRHGVPLEDLNRHTATYLIDKLIKRQQQGLATYKQCKLLLSRGIPYQIVELLTIPEASALISSLQKGRWIYFATVQPPKGVDELIARRKSGTFP